VSVHKNLSGVIIITVMKFLLNVTDFVGKLLYTEGTFVKNGNFHLYNAMFKYTLMIELALHILLCVRKKLVSPLFIALVKIWYFLVKVPNYLRTHISGHV
jgi:hypothetical protein